MQSLQKVFGVDARLQGKKLPLLPAERVFEAADCVLNLSLDPVGLALGLQLGVTNRLAGGLLDGALDLFRRSDDSVLIHELSFSAVKESLGSKAKHVCSVLITGVRLSSGDETVTMARAWSALAAIAAPAINDESRSKFAFGAAGLGFCTLSLCRRSDPSMAGKSKFRRLAPWLILGPLTAPLAEGMFRNLRKGETVLASLYAFAIPIILLDLSVAFRLMTRH